MTADLLDDFDAVVVQQPPEAARQAHRQRRRKLLLWFVHSSGRFDRSTVVWRRSLGRLRERGSVVTGTESAGRDARSFRAVLSAVGWDFVHLAGAAVGECYASWDGEVLELAGRPFARKLTDLTWVRSPEYGGKPAAKVHALVVPLRKRRGRRSYALVVVHMPLDNTDQRAACWIDCCRGLIELKADLQVLYPDAEIVIVGDFNKNLRERDEAAHVEKRLERPLGMVTSWRGRIPKFGGTHTRQLIDFAIAAAFAACQLLVDDDASDHRPFRYRLRSAANKAMRRVAARLRPTTPPKETP